MSEILELTPGLSERPKLFGNHPFPPDLKRPVVIRDQLIQPFIYPPDQLEHSDLNLLYASTDRLTVATYQLGPGGVFDPPDLHEGDEIYYVLDGVVTQHNPITGEFAQAKKGEALILPKGAWHKAYNFEPEIMRLLYVIAPKIWADQTPPAYDAGRVRMYKCGSPAAARAGSSTSWPGWSGSDDIGRWPLPGAELRADPPHYYRITDERKLVTVHGVQNPMLVRFFVSNDLVHMGEFVLPSGGTGPRFSEIDSHGGDAVLFVEQGSVSVFLPVEEQAYVVNREEAMFLPEGTRYRLINYGGQPVKIIFSIAPDL